MMQACVCLLSMSYAWVLWFVGRPMFTKMKPSNKLILCGSTMPGFYQHNIYAEAVAYKNSNFFTILSSTSNTVSIVTIIQVHIQ